jgi:hypothetical protein
VLCISESKAATVTIGAKSTVKKSTPLMSGLPTIGGVVIGGKQPQPPASAKQAAPLSTAAGAKTTAAAKATTALPSKQTPASSAPAASTLNIGAKSTVPSATPSADAKKIAGTFYYVISIIEFLFCYCKDVVSSGGKKTSPDVTKEGII